jgi:hypothetical protein
MKSSSRWSLILSATVFLTVTLKADTLVLRDGRRIEGQLISVRNGVVEFDDARSFGGRTLRIDRDQVLGIQFDPDDGDGNRNPSRPQSRGGGTSGLRERQVMVQANVPWIDTNVNVQSGQDVYFQAVGEVTWGPGRRHGPGGETGSPMNANRPMPNRPAAALIGRVGDNTTDHFFIGINGGPIRMRSSGRLFLGVNDDYLVDNSGSFRVVIYY